MAQSHSSGKFVEEGADRVGDGHLEDQGEKAERGEDGASHSDLLLAERRAVHALHAPGEGDAGVQQQERAEEGDAARGAWRRAEQLFHGRGRVARQCEPFDDRLADHVLLPGGSSAGDDDEQRDQRGERLGGDHDRAVEALHPDEAQDASPQERVHHSLGERGHVVRALGREPPHRGHRRESALPTTCAVPTTRHTTFATCACPTRPARGPDAAHAPPPTVARHHPRRVKPVCTAEGIVAPPRPAERGTR